MPSRDEVMAEALRLCANINPFGSVENARARDAARAALQQMRLRLVRAENVKPGDVVVFRDGSSYVVDSVEDDKIGGIRHRFNDDTGTICWLPGQLCHVREA